ncbi:MAG: DUF1800 domain-containing protein [Acidimicrobiia bacterium]|nr:DUF1800 domain-containing protein [Acidimicrobiia bacterium]
MTFSTEERISHVFRRLGFGAQPDLVASVSSAEEAIGRALDLSATPADIPIVEPPIDTEAARDRDTAGLRFWLEQMITSPRRIEERLIWFWHDHFATDARKVQLPYLLYQQHLLLRSNATGSFADLLHGITTDPAMLIYLDGVDNAVGEINENYGREVMELFTMGRGSYTEEDVVAASRSFSGWVIYRPDGRVVDFFEGEPWQSVFLTFRHDSGVKTLLGRTGTHDASAAIDIILDQPVTGRFIAGKLYEELVGLRPDEATKERLGAVFAAEYEVMPLVESIVAEPAFLSDEAIRAKKRTPLEQAVGIAQAFGLSEQAGGYVGRALEQLGYLPYRPANVAGFPKGRRLLGPHTLIHTFDLMMLAGRASMAMTTDELATRLGLFDVSDTTRQVLADAGNPVTRLALAINSPEYHVV